MAYGFSKVVEALHCFLPVVVMRKVPFVEVFRLSDLIESLVFECVDQFLLAQCRSYLIVWRLSALYLVLLKCFYFYLTAA